MVGETPNLAARLQGMAPANGVIIAEATRRLLGDLFEYRDLGTAEVKGLDSPVVVWQVLRPSTVASRFEALRSTSLSPFVGRDAEMELLLRRWERAKEAEGQIVLISGEPGSVSPALLRHCRSGSSVNHTFGCGISVRRIIATARFTRLLLSWNTPPAFHAKTPPRQSATSSPHCSPDRATARPTLWRCSMICWDCRSKTDCPSTLGKSAS